MFSNALFPPQLYPLQLFPRATVSNILSLSNNIFFTSSIDVNITINKSNINTLSFTNSVISSHIINRSLNNTLSFIQTVSAGSSITKVLNQTLSLTDSVSVDRKITNSHLISTIIFTDSLTVFHYGGLNQIVIDNLLVFDSIVFIEHTIGAGVTPLNVSLTNTLILTDTLHTNIVYNRLNADLLTFTQNVGTPNRLRLNDILSFTQIVSPKLNIHRNIIDTLSFTQLVTSSHYKYSTITNTLVFTQTLVGLKQKNRTLSNTLFFTQTLNYSKYKNIRLVDRLFFTDTLSLSSNVNISLTDVIFFRAGGGYSSESPNASTIVDSKNVIYSDVIPVLVHRYIILKGAKSNIVLPAPLFGDSQGNIASIITNRMVNGQVYTYLKTTKRQKLVYKFELKRQKAYELQTFIESNDLQYINLENWKGELWYVRLTNNPTIFTATGRGYVCPNNAEVQEIELEFEGIRLSGSAVSC